MRHEIRMRDDSGVAMIAVIGTLALVTVISIAAFTMSRQSLHETGIVRGNSQAFQLADSGLEVALANIQANGFNPDASHFGGVLDGVGSWEVTVTPEADSQYLAVSTGIDSVSGLTEKVKTKFFYLNIWEMNIAGDQDSLTAGGGGITGTSNVTGPFYVVGDIDMGGTSYIHNGPFFVKGGDIELSGNATIGELANPINVYVSGSYPATRFFASSVSHAVPTIVLPRVDDDYLHRKWVIAKAESVDNHRGTQGVSEVANLEANGASPLSYTNYANSDGTFLTRNKAPDASPYYKYIGPEGGPSPAGSGTTGLVIGDNTNRPGGTQRIGAWSGAGGAYPAGNTSWDDLAWDPATRTLYVEGTVLVDGPVTFEGGTGSGNQINYRGNGTIIANGNITINCWIVPEGSAGVPATMPLDTDRALGLVTPTNIIFGVSANNVDPVNPPHVAGALYAGQMIHFKNNILFKGSVIAGSMKFDHPNVHLVTDPRLPSFLPDGMPGKNMSLLTRGTWAR